MEKVTDALSTYLIKDVIGVVESYIDKNVCVKCGRFMLELRHWIDASDPDHQDRCSYPRWIRTETSEDCSVWRSGIDEKWDIDQGNVVEGNVNFCEKCESVQYKCRECRTYCELSLLPNYLKDDVKDRFSKIRSDFMFDNRGMRSATDAETDYFDNNDTYNRATNYLVPPGEFAYPTANTPKGHWITGVRRNEGHAWHCLTCDVYHWLI